MPILLKQYHTHPSPMSDYNVTVAPLKSLETTKDGAVAFSKDTHRTMDGTQQVKSEQKPDTLTKQPARVKLTDLNYSINHEDKALHLKVKSADGEVVREVVFDRIDPSLLDAKKLKGIFIDDNS